MKSGLKCYPRIFGNQVLGLALLLGVGGAAVPRPAAAAPAKRFSMEARGDFVLLGNTLAQDCAAGVVAPTTGTVATNCGLNTSDSAPDVFWRADSPAAGQAETDVATIPSGARTTSVLALPQGATVVYARLYWAARPGLVASSTATFERPGTFNMDVTADASSTVNLGGILYQRTADVTQLVKQHGAGAYRVGNIESALLANVNDASVATGWYMVVFYRLDSLPHRSMTLYDGLDAHVTTGTPLSLGGFRVPATGIGGKLAVVAFDGDSGNGDGLSVNGTPISNGENPADNFFNSSRTHLGAPQSLVGDLPRLTGAANSMSGLDLDVVDISAQLRGGDSALSVQPTTDADTFITGAYVTSVSTVRPDFSGMTLSVRNLTREIGFLPGDEVEYSLILANSGSDTATEVRVSDPLPAGVTYLDGSLQILTGANAGAKTDAGGDDQAEYDTSSRTITFRLGQGATATAGGTVPVGEQAMKLRFRARINQDATGDIATQSTLQNKGAYAVSVGNMDIDSWLSGNDTELLQPTVFTVGPGGGGDGPDVSLSFTGEVINGGGAVRYTATATNSGNEAAPRLVLSYRVPADVQIEDVEAGEGWTCGTDVELFVCSYDRPLDSGSAPPVRFTVKPTGPQKTLAYEAKIEPIDEEGQPIEDTNADNNTVTGETSGLSGVLLSGGGFSCAMQPRPSQAPLALGAAALLTLGLLRRRRRA